ncbi:Uncharacterised protein [Mycobacteroides abscessus subsp. abscessus]|nr:Uncharacterised protein [Mycobacteroides abscessus subsp. abscessus]
MGEAEPAQLCLHVRHVRVRRDPRMLPGLDRVEVGRQAEGVVGERVHDIAPAHALVATVDVGAEVAQGMSDVESRARGVGEHVHDVEGFPLAEVGRRSVRGR